MAVDDDCGESVPGTPGPDTGQVSTSTMSQSTAQTKLPDEPADYLSRRQTAHIDAVRLRCDQRLPPARHRHAHLPRVHVKGRTTRCHSLPRDDHTHAAEYAELPHRRDLTCAIDPPPIRRAGSWSSLPRVAAPGRPATLPERLAAARPPEPVTVSARSICAAVPT